MTEDTDVIAMRNATAALEEAQHQITQLAEENTRLKGKRLPKAVSAQSVLGGTDIPFYNSGRNYIIGYADPSNQKKRD